MAAKYFCDGCGDEITPDRRTSRDQQGRLFGRVSIPGGRSMFVQVTTGTESTWNHGDFCNVCIATCLRAALGAKDGDVIAPPRDFGAPTGSVMAKCGDEAHHDATGETR